MSLFSEFAEAFEAAQNLPSPSSDRPPKTPPAAEVPRRFRPVERNQSLLVPLDLERMLDESHPARAIWDFVGGLDLSRFEEKVLSVEGRAGRDAWSPRLLISIWIYAYSRGISSARERAERVQEALAEVAELAARKKHEKDKEPSASLTDPEAQFMKTNDHGLAPAYNVQLVNDSAKGFIVDVAVSKQPSDAEHLVPALDRVKASTGSYPKQVIADGDYTNRKSIIAAFDKGVEFYGSWRGTTEGRPGRGIDPRYAPSAFEWDEAANEVICPMGKRLVHIRTNTGEGNSSVWVYAASREDCQKCKKRKLCTPNNKMVKHGRAVGIRLEDDRVSYFLAKMETAEAKAIYKQRAPVAEFPNAWIKTKLNWVRVRPRGLKRVAAEAIWPALTYNLQRYFAITRQEAAAAPA